MVAQRTLIRLALALVALAFAPLAAADQFLWEVSSLTNKVYLFGTVHAGKRGWYPLAPAIENAFNDSSVLVVEADITNEKAMTAPAEALSYKPPDELKNHVPPEQYARLLKLLPRYRLRESDIAHSNPFMAVSLLVFAEWGRAGYLPQYGVDLYLIKKAKGDLKKIVEIEGVDEQIRLMDSLTEQEVRTVFAGTITALDSGLTTEQINGMVDSWRGGNATRMLEIARSYNEKVPGAAEFEEKFIWSRHPQMLAKIDDWLNRSKQRYFIAVGALHLAGPRGLVEELRKRGYVVRQR